MALILRGNQNEKLTTEQLDGNFTHLLDLINQSSAPVASQGSKIPFTASESVNAGKIAQVLFDGTVKEFKITDLTEEGYFIDSLLLPDGRILFLYVTENDNGYYYGGGQTKAKLLTIEGYDYLWSEESILIEGFPPFSPFGVNLIWDSQKNLVLVAQFENIDGGGNNEYLLLKIEGDEVTIESEVNSSLGTFGWDDLSDVSSRIYTTFISSNNNRIGNNVLNQDFVMRETTTGRYWKIKFSKWTQGGGGGFEYTRTEINSGGVEISAPVTFEKTDGGSEQDVIIPDVLVITRDGNGPIYNIIEGKQGSNVDPVGTEWNSQLAVTLSEVSSIIFHPILNRYVISYYGDGITIGLFELLFSNGEYSLNKLDSFVYESYGDSQVQLKYDSSSNKVTAVPASLK